MNRSPRFAVRCSRSAAHYIIVTLSPRFTDCRRFRRAVTPTKLLCQRVLTPTQSRLPLPNCNPAVTFSNAYCLQQITADTPSPAAHVCEPPPPKSSLHHITGHQPPCCGHSSTKCPERHPTRRVNCRRSLLTSHHQSSTAMLRTLLNKVPYTPPIPTIATTAHIFSSPHRDTPHTKRQVTARQNKTKKEAAFGNLSTLVLHTRIELVFAD